MNRRVVRSMCLVTALFLAPKAAHAQAAQNSIVAAVSMTEFDLAGVGTAPGMIIRASRALTGHVAVEGSFQMSWLSEDFGRSKLFAPEAHLQYHWQAGSFRPYVGGGAGIAWRDRGLFGNSEANLTLSVVGGTRFDVTERLGLLGELRLRGIDPDFSGSTADVMGGVSWRW
jgi:outer membrane protein with beta-barrel domain